MRSSALVILLVLSLLACGSNAQRRCTPVPSFSAPAGECIALAEAPQPPPPPKKKKAPEPEPEPEPAPEPEPEPAPEPPPTVVVTKEKIELDRTVQFESGKAVLIADSKQLLDDVVKVLQEHPEILLVRIEGHTDSVGRDRANKRLSDKRAKAVRTYLIAGGIDKKRLVAKGFGESKPLDDNNTEEGRFKNRRVDLKILKRDESAAEPKAEEAKSDDDEADESAAKQGDQKQTKKKKKKKKKQQQAEDDEQP